MQSASSSHIYLPLYQRSRVDQKQIIWIPNNGAPVGENKRVTRVCCCIHCQQWIIVTVRAARDCCKLIVHTHLSISVTPKVWYMHSTIQWKVQRTNHVTDIMHVARGFVDSSSQL